MTYKCVEGLEKFHIVADINVAHNTDRFIQLLSKAARRNVIRVSDRVADADTFLSDIYLYFQLSRPSDIDCVRHEQSTFIV